MYTYVYVDCVPFYYTSSKTLVKGICLFLFIWVLAKIHKTMIITSTKMNKSKVTVQIKKDYSLLFHVEAAGRSKRVEAVEDPVA